MEMKSPPPCPPTVTIRRNPPRKARATPSSAIPLRQPLSSPSLSRDIFSGEPQSPNNTDIITSEASSRNIAENLKVYLRIRPLTIQKSSRYRAASKNAWPRNPKAKCNNVGPKTKKSTESCVQVNEDLRSVTVATPQTLQETKRIKSEVYEGFSHVFDSEASQTDVYEEMVEPLVDEFLQGKSGMLAAMGPSGSGKTHTVFGCAREPGMVPLALRRIFSEIQNGKDLSRVFYLSMFEISSEKGKAERMVDLLHDRGDICMQQSVLKGLQEAVVCDAQRAESLIAHGMLKRATAMTNSNSQSSRSQCIINIRCGSGKDGEEADGKASSSMLTIVDLAGAEREKKTGNQGARLHESNFINNTSMVFSLCLRSLLEHQKNRNKLLQKHYKSSLLTRYLRDYLEGKKRMMLMLTVKPGVEDYLDTSFLLRQASPFTKIKYKTPEEPVNLTSNKRPYQTLLRVDQLKKMKLNASEVYLTDEGNSDRGILPMHKETAEQGAKDCLNPNVEDIIDENKNEVHVSSDGLIGLGIREEPSPREDYRKMESEKNRDYKILQGLSKALLTVLKQYKTKLKGVETENCHLKDSLINEEKRSLDLENKLACERKRLLDLENEVTELRSRSTCRNVSPVAVQDSFDDISLDLSQYPRAELQEMNIEVSSYSFKQLEESQNEEKTGPSITAGDSVVTSVSSRGGVEKYSQNFEDLIDRNDYGEEAKCRDIFPVDMCVLSPEFSRSAKISLDLISYEEKCIEDVYSENEASSESNATIYTGDEAAQDSVNVTRDVKNFEGGSVCVSEGSCEATSVECESLKCFQEYEDLIDAKVEPTELDNGAAGEGLSLVEEQVVSVATGSQAIINSSESPKKDGICFHEDEERLDNEDQKEDPLVAVPPEEGCDGGKTARFVAKHDSCSNVQQKKKPKRRLRPASSVMLKDISILDIKEEIDKPKVGRGGKRDDKNRTQGSLSLINLLTN